MCWYWASKVRCCRGYIWAQRVATQESLIELCLKDVRVRHGRCPIFSGLFLGVCERDSHMKSRALQWGFNAFFTVLRVLPLNLHFVSRRGQWNMYCALVYHLHAVLLLITPELFLPGVAAAPSLSSGSVAPGEIFMNLLHLESSTTVS